MRVYFLRAKAVLGLAWRARDVAGQKVTLGKDGVGVGRFRGGEDLQQDDGGESAGGGASENVRQGEGEGKARRGTDGRGGTGGDRRGRRDGQRVQE